MNGTSLILINISIPNIIWDADIHQHDSCFFNIVLNPVSAGSESPNIVRDADIHQHDSCFFNIVLNPVSAGSESPNVVRDADTCLPTGRYISMTVVFFTVILNPAANALT